MKDERPMFQLLKRKPLNLGDPWLWFYALFLINLGLVLYDWSSGKR